MFLIIQYNNQNKSLQQHVDALHTNQLLLTTCKLEVYRYYSNFNFGGMFILIILDLVLTNSQ